jgi:hypothetical protein
VLRAHQLVMGSLAVGWALLVAYGCVTAADGEESEETCPVGTEGCDCTRGGACDPGLACLSDFCVDAGPQGGSGGMASGPGPSSGGGPATTGAGAGTTTTTGGGGSMTTTTTGSGGGGGSCAVPDPTNVVGCPSCEACDTWNVTWDPVATATHYKVAFTCLGSYESPNILDTDAELCLEVGMCSYCSFGASALSVKACDATCCSAGTPVLDGAPIGCQVDCCV